MGMRTNAANVDALQAELDQWYKDQKSTSRLQGKLSVLRIRTSKGWPKLKGKGAATRHLAEFALDLARRHLMDCGASRKKRGGSGSMFG